MPTKILRGTFEFPPLNESRRYRPVVGGSAHVTAGEGFALYVDDKLLVESNAGGGERQGGQLRSGHVYADLREDSRAAMWRFRSTAF